MNNNKTNQTELIDRYVYAVTRRLPHSMREDVDKELRTLIEDMLTERCGEEEPAEKDVRIVLTELGTPSELASRYDPNGDKSLISPKLYPSYLMVLKIVLICVGASLVLAAIMNAILDPLEFTHGKTGMSGIITFFVRLFAQTLGELITAFLASFGAVTFAFAIVDRKGADFDFFGSDDLSRLPAVPKKKYTIKKSDCIVSIFFSVVFLLLFCFVPQFAAVYGTGTGESVQIFNVQGVKDLWPLWLVFFGLGIADDICKLLVGCYNKLVMTVTVVTDLLSLAVAGIAMFGFDIMNKMFSSELAELLLKEGVKISTGEKVLTTALSAFNVIFFGIMAVIIIIDMLDTVIKTIRAQESK